MPGSVSDVGRTHPCGFPFVVKSGIRSSADSGADYYITKPFSTGRIARPDSRGSKTFASHRRAKDEDRRGRFSHPPRRPYGACTRTGRRLTPKEFDVLAYMAQHPGKVLTHRAILNAVWEAIVVHSGLLASFVGQLRKKIELDLSAPKYILTEPWVGYRFEPGDQDKD